MKYRPFRKLPAPAIVEREYWFNNLNQEAIAAKYGVRRSTVGNYMRRHGIRCRRGGRWSSGQCILCGLTACQVRAGAKDSPRWVTSSYCLVHYMRRKRAYLREYFRERLPNRQQPYQPRPRRQDIQESPWIREMHAE